MGRIGLGLCDKGHIVGNGRGLRRSYDMILCIPNIIDGFQLEIQVRWRHRHLLRHLRHLGTLQFQNQ